MTTKEVLKKVYVSEDGCEFHDEFDCLRYEQSLKKVIEQRKLLSEVTEVKALRDVKPLDGEWYDTDTKSIRWYNPKTKEEAEILKEVFGINLKIDRAINNYICIERFDFDEFIIGDETYFSYLDDSIDNIETFLGKFGYKVARE